MVLTWMTIRLETSAAAGYPSHYGSIFRVPTWHRGSLGGAGKMTGRKRNFDGFG